ncbi:HSP20 family molecular chaperone IbpA [Paraburkholderia bannensis]|uniref:HSP20 family molecular chaperone IbpA n=1 Tax=Paraburkholderia bannensis TaxID=765414 RepID=A0A7W9WU68_9BURK|nr:MULTISPECIES: Hsp20/alpha crystallin family protein [Paraburkholderia]MBB3259021.1 HSP20 family molecular chaperone IbpA [Paraburkholderia sp. WP4_3_2]MBB6104036.1 HSP20 family molecular chaperone IbpA [Paraburkholderia bannensis]
MNDSTELISRESHADVASHEAAHAAKPPFRIAPAVDIVEDSHGITLFADLPGVPREKLDVRVQDSSLNIEAEAVIPTPSGLRLQHGEVRHPHFWRAFTLSPDFDVSRIDAQLRDGVLKLTIPRRENAKPRRIQVNVG